MLSHAHEHHFPHSPLSALSGVWFTMPTIATRPAYYIDGEVRPPFRGLWVKFIRAHLFVPTLSCYLLLCFARLPHQLYNNSLSIVIFIGLRIFITLMFSGSIIYSDWLHNLDTIHDGTCNTPTLELSILRWDMWFIGGIIFSEQVFIGMSAPSNEIRDIILFNQWNAVECLIITSAIFFLFLSMLLSQISLKKVLTKNTEERKARGLGKALLKHDGMAYKGAKLCLTLQFFSCFITCYVTNNWLNSYSNVIVQLIGFTCFLFKDKSRPEEEGSGSNNKRKKSIEYWPIVLRPLVRLLKIEDVGGHEIMHVSTHSSWCIFIVSDLWVAWYGG